MKWYTVEDVFLKYLRSYEGRIPENDYGADKFKPFFGALFEIGDLVYISQVSHPQSRHSSIKENLDFVKLYDKEKLLAVVNLNYMFPVHKSKLIEVEYRNIQDFRAFENDNKKNNYITLLKREMKEIKIKQVADKAMSLYRLRYDYPNNRISLRCLDFKKIEQKCLEFVQADTAAIKTSSEQVASTTSIKQEEK